MFYRKLLAYFFLFLIISCGKQESLNEIEVVGEPIFKLIDAEQTRVFFENTLNEGPNTNILMYEYFYNGGGVATADFNNDGLDDLYFTSNMGENKMYQNKGNFTFEDISVASGAAGRPGPWKTGVSVVDVNADGKLDIYLCYSGALPSEKRKNQLFVNQGLNEKGQPTFVDEAQKYGLDSDGYSNQGYFFDADKDGDLDMLLLNHNPKNLPILNVEATKEFNKKDSPEMGLRLFIQNNGKFNDQTTKSGINGSALSYGLGLSISDVNNDGWLDFYVSNDYSVPDYLYINNKNGTFSNKLSSQIGHTSQFSMGNNIVDVNNDGFTDIFTLDMLPEGNERQKLLQAPDNFSAFDLNVKSGFYYQYMRNMLHLNNGNETFSEIGQMAGISNTDWSWSPLFADYDNDGFKDLYITNGYVRDYTNQDFIKYMNNFVAAQGRLSREDVLQIIQKMPSSNLSNYMYSNVNGESFKDQSIAWGINMASNSNGAAYSDLDNDGDLDLVVNNINKQAFIFQNQSAGQNSLNIKLEGLAGNTMGIGAKITTHCKGNMQVLEQNPNRGYLSAVSPTLHFGLNKNAQVDSITVQWPSGNTETRRAIKANQTLILKESESMKTIHSTLKLNALLTEVPNPFKIEQVNSNFQDFDRQALLNREYSHMGTLLIKGDLNNDGLEDIFIGGDVNQSAQIYIQSKNGGFSKANVTVFEIDKASQDRDAIIFDANNDKINDIYVASGGYHDFKEGDPILLDRLYFGKGNGTFEKAENMLPSHAVASSCIAACDYNNDGAIDLFIGSNLVPGFYPKQPKSYLLVNDGKGKFKTAQELDLGMVNDAEWVDLDLDNKKELITVGEWTPLNVWSLKSKKLEKVTNLFFEKDYLGWWNHILVSDFNGDNKPDLLFGNVGLNTQFKATTKEPLSLQYADFDKNGSIDPIFSFYLGGKQYPFVTRDELAIQIPSTKSKFTSYGSYALVTTDKLFDGNEIEKAPTLIANHMKTSLFLSSPEGKLKESILPSQVQYSCINTSISLDIDNDGDNDLLLWGNNNRYKIKLGQMDASFGICLLNDGKGKFKYTNQSHSEMKTIGDVGSSLIIDDQILLGRNEKPIVSFKINR